MFYCTFDDKPQAQWIRHAVSRDLTDWQDILEDKFGPDGIIYRMTDWRDPFVFWNQEAGKWWMLVAARENRPTERNGCVALCVSDDLSRWEYEKPLYSPGIFMDGIPPEEKIRGSLTQVKITGRITPAGTGAARLLSTSWCSMRTAPWGCVRQTAWQAPSVRERRHGGNLWTGTGGKRAMP